MLFNSNIVLLRVYNSNVSHTKNIYLYFNALIDLIVRYGFKNMFDFFVLYFLDPTNNF